MATINRISPTSYEVTTKIATYRVYQAVDSNNKPRWHLYNVERDLLFKSSYSNLATAFNSVPAIDQR